MVLVGVEPAVRFVFIQEKIPHPPMVLDGNNLICTKTKPQAHEKHELIPMTDRKSLWMSVSIVSMQP